MTVAAAEPFFQLRTALPIPRRLGGVHSNFGPSGYLRWPVDNARGKSPKAIFGMGESERVALASATRFYGGELCSPNSQQSYWAGAAAPARFAGAPYMARIPRKAVRAGRGSASCWLRDEQKNWAPNLRLEPNFFVRWWRRRLPNRARFFIERVHEILSSQRENTPKNTSIDGRWCCGPRHSHASPPYPSIAGAYPVHAS